MRHRIWSAALAAAAIFIVAGPPARADNYPVRDGTGASQTFCSKLVGGLQYPCHLVYGMFGSAPTPVTTDGTNLNVHVQVSDLPTGASTAANQSSQLTQETAVNTVLGTQADAAWSGSGSGTAIAIQKYVAAKVEASRALLAGTLTVQFASPQAVTQSGVWNVTNISGAVSLPTGAATAANQTSANTKLDQLHTDLIAATPAGTAIIGKVGIDQTTPGTTNVVSPQYGASGVSAVTCALTSATTCGPLTPIAGRGFNVSAWGTFVAAFQMERSFDSGTTWLPITAAGTQLYQWTAAASEQAEETEAAVQYRVRATSYTSGTLNVRLSQ